MMRGAHSFADQGREVPLHGRDVGRPDPTARVLRTGARQSLEDARDNLAASIAATAGKKRPLLVDISRCEPLEPPVRHYYTGKLLIDSFSALGLLIEISPFGRMMGNVYLRVARPG